MIEAGLTERWLFWDHGDAGLLVDAIEAVGALDAVRAATWRARFARAAAPRPAPDPTLRAGALAHLEGLAGQDADTLAHHLAEANVISLADRWAITARLRPSPPEPAVPVAPTGIAVLPPGAAVVWIMGQEPCVTVYVRAGTIGKLRLRDESDTAYEQFGHDLVGGEGAVVFTPCPPRGARLVLEGAGQPVAMTMP